MGKICKLCSNSFEDKTNRQNKVYCYNSNCLRERSKLYRKTRNNDKYLINQQRFKESNPNYLKNWRSNNSEKDKKLNRDYRKNKYANDINFKLTCILRSRIYNAIKYDFKVGSTINNLGCSIEEFKLYLESKFEPWMNWDNYGEYNNNISTWQIDHIKPLANFDLTDEKQFKIAVHYTNQQPMLSLTNKIKSNK